MILSSDYKGWNISENFIGEKNLGHEPWEFGYAVGASRPLRLGRHTGLLQFLPRKFRGGRGNLRRPGNCGESHAVRHFPLFRTDGCVGASEWSVVPISPGFGLNDNSHRLLLRWGLTYEISGFGRKVRSLFR